jgi:hypothetical protein
MCAGIRLILGSILLAGISTPALSQSSATCHGADDFSGHLIAMAQSLMAPADSTLRSKLGMPLVSTSQVTLATDPAVCLRAGQALDSVGRAMTPGQPDPPPSSNPLYVVQIGSSFAVLDRNIPVPQHYYYVFYFGPLWEFRRVATF